MACIQIRFVPDLHANKPIAKDLLRNFGDANADGGVVERDANKPIDGQHCGYVSHHVDNFGCVHERGRFGLLFTSEFL